MSTITVTVSIDGEKFQEFGYSAFDRDAADMRTIATRMTPAIHRAMTQTTHSGNGVYRQSNRGVELADGEPFTRNRGSTDDEPDRQARTLVLAQDKVMGVAYARDHGIPVQWVATPHGNSYNGIRGHRFDELVVVGDVRLTTEAFQAIWPVFAHLGYHECDKRADQLRQLLDIKVV
ncbi:hypothetical protein [Corynebacterium glyciniphilum]|uniref:hypothetical protein n=1 Tax=Corynebacterium glyciniphilum TaxID=1404244 RepID=UPI00264D9061|nr:hypothetical protein [Corynebacterium glyciniphilum]MDN6706389.1 hypothetical protein [Corynebacterium glyciniphilum]